MARQTVFYIAVLIAFSIGVAYFVGLSTDANSVFAGVTKLVYALQLRNPQTGQFAAYPGGAPQGGKVQGG